MDLLETGAILDAKDVRIPDAPSGTPITIERAMGDCPHGHGYVAQCGASPLLVTILDPAMVEIPTVREPLVRDLERAGTIEHRNLVRTLGIGRHGPTLFTVQEHPGGGSVRSFMQRRLARGKTIPLKEAFTLAAHVCNAVAALHRAMVHAYVTADTVYVNAEGRVRLTAAGVGPSLVRAPGFQRFRAAGLLPNVAPEQLGGQPLVFGTDVFGIATLVIELLCGRGLAQAGQDLVEFGLAARRPIVDCLERATAPDPSARQPDPLAFKQELAAALAESERGSLAVPVAPRLATPRAEATDGITVRPPPSPSTPAVASSGHELGLDLPAFEQIAERLATIDGESGLIGLGALDEPADRPGNAPRAKAPTTAGDVYFGSYAEDHAATPAEPPDAGGQSAARARYIYTRDGIDHGPYDLEALGQLIRRGELRSVDYVRERTAREPMLVVDVPELREICTEILKQHERALLRAPMPIGLPEAPKYNRSWLGTLAWVAVVLGGFAILAWVLWQRANGGSS